MHIPGHRFSFVGAAVGEIIIDDSGKGDAVGVVIGGNRQARRNQQAQEQYQSAMQYQQSEVDAMLQSHNRTRAASLEGRDYTIN